MENRDWFRKGRKYGGKYRKREDTERSSGGKRGKREAATVREGIKRKEGMWRETGAGTVTNKSPSMTAFCWSISFSHNIMVCYCPLSVLSVPESILNEGQLHLAAIFQLSPRCHGNPVVSRWTCRWRGVGGGEKGSQCCKRLGCQGVEWEEGQHLGPRDKAEKKRRRKKEPHKTGLSHSACTW